MKSKRKKYPAGLMSQIKWAEEISEEDVKRMLIDGVSKTSCGCEVIGEAVCPHDNMGVLQLLMLQLTEKELEEMRAEITKTTE